MRYENPQLPEGINVSEEHPLKDFGFLLLAVGGATVALVVLLFALADIMVRYIPFSMEERLAKAVLPEATLSIDKENLPVQAYLQALADQLAREQGLPDDMRINVHYVDDDTVNAFATLGGHILLHRGLLARLPNENAVAMVIAHEIAHIKHRDPIIAAGRGLTVALALSSLMGFGDSAFSQELVGHLTTVTALAFSRDQEQAADQEALQTLTKHYGHTAGSMAVFEVLQQDGGIEPPAFLSSHPLTEDRLAQVRTFGRGEQGEVSPLPKGLFQKGFLPINDHGGPEH